MNPFALWRNILWQIGTAMPDCASPMDSNSELDERDLGSSLSLFAVSLGVGIKETIER